MALFTFNSAEHAAPRAQYDILPRGWYQAILTESGASATAAGGQRLTFVATITAPEWAKGRKVFMGFNVAHPTSEETVRIGNEQLSGMSVAVGVPSWTNTEQLHNQPFYIRLKVRKGGKNEQTQEEYDDSNEPQGFDNLKNYHDMAKQPVQQAQGAAPAAGSFPVAPAVPGAPAGLPAGAFPGVPPVVAPATPVVATPTVPATPGQPAVVAGAPVQPWEQPAAAPVVAAPILQAPAEVAQQVTAPAAPVVPVVPVVAQAPATPVVPVVADPFAGWTAEQINTWVAQNPTHPLAQERMAAAQAAAAAAPVAPVVAAEPAPAAQPAWAATPVVPTPAATPSAAAAPVVAEAAHPAQAAIPPWQVPAGTPAA